MTEHRDPDDEAFYHDGDSSRLSRWDDYRPRRLGRPRPWVSLPRSADVAARLPVDSAPVEVRTTPVLDLT